jgi:hypothetical protein
MKPYETYPTSIVWKDIKYELNLSYKAVLLVLDVFDDNQLSAQDKCEIALDILVKNEHPNDYYLLEAIFDLIRPEEKGTGEKIIDFEKDFYFIIASFRQAYGIDIVRENLHYLEFVALLNGMPEGTKIVDIIRIRTMEIPQMNEHNKEEVQKLLELKARYSLKQENNFNDGLAKLFNRLKGEAK